ncbi:MAG: hypothetical protein ABJB03_01290 [Rhodoglobus sp.]
MRTILLAYDPTSSPQNYQRLDEYLKSYSVHWRFLETTWISTEKTPAQVIGEALALTGGTDRVFAIEVSGKPANWNGFSPEGTAWLRQVLAA